MPIVAARGGGGSVANIEHRPDHGLLPGCCSNAEDDDDGVGGGDDGDDDMAVQGLPNDKGFPGVGAESAFAPGVDTAAAPEDPDEEDGVIKLVKCHGAVIRGPFEDGGETFSADNDSKFDDEDELFPLRDAVEEEVVDSVGLEFGAILLVMSPVEEGFVEEDGEEDEDGEEGEGL